MQHLKATEGVAPPDALSVVGVSHAYGHKRVLTNVSFGVPTGSFAVLLGLNGAGKTTLFSLISRLFDTREGTIRIFGHEIRRHPGEALRRLGIVFQSRTLDLDLSIYQNLCYHASLHGIGSANARRRIEELLAQVGMSDRTYDKVRSLSGGQMRRVEITRALLHHPQLLLLDEATVGLDIQSRAEILETIRKLVETSGIGVLWATHLIDEVEPSDNVVILHKGIVLAKARVSDVIASTGSSSIAEAFNMLTVADPVSSPGRSG